MGCLTARVLGGVAAGRAELRSGRVYKVGP